MTHFERSRLALLVGSHPAANASRRLIAELRGVPALAVETTIEPQRKGTAVTRSFGTPVLDHD